LQAKAEDLKAMENFPTMPLSDDCPRASLIARWP
jgi:hypothetical protein